MVGPGAGIFRVSPAPASTLRAAVVAEGFGVDWRDALDERFRPAISRRVAGSDATRELDLDPVHRLGAAP